MTLEFDPRTGFAQAEDKMGELMVVRYLPASGSTPLSPSSSAISTTTRSNTALSSNSFHTTKSSSERVQQLMPVGMDDLYADWARYSLECPRGLVLLPGNEVHIVVNADTIYEKRDNSNHFGMKCQVVGYEWTNTPNNVRDKG